MKLELNVVRFEANDIMTASGHVCAQVTAENAWNHLYAEGQNAYHTDLTFEGATPEVGQKIDGVEIGQHTGSFWAGYRTNYFVPGYHANNIDGKYFELVNGAWVLCDEHNN